MGSAVFAEGWNVVQWQGLKDKVLIPSLLAPFLGIVVAFMLILVITWVIARRSPAKVNRVFRRLQLVSGGFVAFTHGTNDAQKTMGIIALALVAPELDGTHAPASIPMRSRSSRRARCSWALQVPTATPSMSAASSWL